MPAPVVVGVYLVHRLMTTASEPAILRLWPGRIRIETAGGVLLDAPAQSVPMRWQGLGYAASLQLPAGVQYKGSDRVLVTALGTPSSSPFPPEVEASIRREQALSAQDPETRALRLGADGWIGRPRVEAKYFLLLGSVLPRNLKQQLRDNRLGKEVGAELRRTLGLCGLPEVAK